MKLSRPLVLAPLALALVLGSYAGIAHAAPAQADVDTALCSQLDPQVPLVGGLTLDEPALATLKAALKLDTVAQVQASTVAAARVALACPTPSTTTPPATTTTSAPATTTTAPPTSSSAPATTTSASTPASSSAVVVPDVDDDGFTQVLDIPTAIDTGRA